MELTLHKGFTEEQIKQFGPLKGKHEVLETERHVYFCPFMYPNVEVGDFYEIDPDKGIEFKADTGFVTIKEDKSIVAVNVVGSGCYSKGYNICEWWPDGESIDNMANQLVKRQRIDNLNGIHPSVFMTLLGATKQISDGLTYRDIDSGIKDPVDCLKKFTENYYDSIHLGFYENTACFRIGSPYAHKVTIRSGCMLPEVPGMRDVQQRADYAVRIVEIIVIK